jgi:DNA-binding MarR family transcriptional regulator
VGNAFETFSLTIEQIGKNMQKYKHEKALELGLRGIHVMCLYQLDKSKDGMTAAKLAEACGVNRAFISRIVAELLAEGHIAYADSALGRRYRSRLYLTERGRKTVQEMNLRIEEAVEKVGGDIRVRDLTIFYAILRRLDRRIAALVSEESPSADTAESKKNSDVKENTITREEES